MDEEMEADMPPEASPASEETPKLARDSGTLFERMSNIARGAAQAQAEDDEAVPGFRREPLDIPRFLNRQNNQ
jgi:cell division protein FtsZ